MKILKIKKLKYFLLICLQFIIILSMNNTYAVSNDFNMSTSTDYTSSSTGSIGFSGGIANLNYNILTHTGVITNATNYNGAYDVVVEGNFAYMTSFLGNRVNILDISNPSNPILTGSILNNGGTIRLQGAAGIVKSGNYLYVASNTSNAVQIINVTNPAAPTPAGQINNIVTSNRLRGARGIFKLGNYIYVASDIDDALVIIDVTTPTAPIWKSAIRNTTTLNGARDVKVVGSYAYVTAYDGDRLTVVDISNPLVPVVSANISDTTNLNGAHNIEISGNYAYVSADLNASVRVIDITTPTAPVAVTNISGGSFSLTNPRDLIVEDNELYISSFGSNAINIADISNPANPVYVTKIVHNATNPLLQGADGLFKVGNLLYVASYTSDALEVLKISYDSTSPTLINTNALNYLDGSEIMSFTETLGASNSGTITYQISNNNGVNWYYWNGSARTSTVLGVTNSNSASVINTNIIPFKYVGGRTYQFKFKAFFTSNGNQKVELDNINIVSNAPAKPGGFGTGLQLWLKSNYGTSTVTDGAALTYWDDESGNGFNAGGGVSPTYYNNSSNNLNFYPVVNFNGSTQYLENLANGAYTHSYYTVIIPNNQINGTISGQVPLSFDCTSGVLNFGSCGLPFAGITLGAFTAAINDEVISHAISSSVDWRSSQIGVASYPANSPMLISVNENSGANGTDIYEKGTKIDNYGVNTYQTLSTADYRIGMSMDPANLFKYNGKIVEIVNYNARLSDTNRIKVESYLSYKYGMMLKSGTQNYIASDGTTTMWNTTTGSGYTNDIFGIGWDEGSDLRQPKSKSANTDAIITLEAIGEGTNMDPLFVDMNDMEFLSISNDDGGNTWTQVDAPAGHYNLTRRWKVQEVGELGTVNLDFDVANVIFDVPALSFGSGYHLTYDSNGNGLLTDEIPLTMTNISGSIWRAAGVNINNGRIFTITTNASANNIPTNITLSNNTINENMVALSTVGTLSTTDPDVGDTHTYSFVTGAGDTDNSSFTITGSTLKINDSPDYELKNSYTVRIQTNDGNGGLYQKQFTINISNLGEAINTILDFEITGKYNVTSGTWTRTLTNPQQGVYSIESNNGGLPNTQSCFVVNNTFNGTGTIDFQYNVSSQAGADYLGFYIDNISQNTWSGTIAWSTYTKTDIVAGTHEYKWCYIKDGATNTGSDKAWVDYITFKDTNPVTDIVAPIISSINHASGSLLPGGNHNIVINYSDADSGIDINSDTISLYKWNGSVWGSDISSAGLNLGGAVITSTSATYPTNNLIYGKYKYDFSISDIATNSSSTGAVFYIDEPEIIVSSGTLDIGDVKSGITKFSSGQLDITVKTVGAGFNLILNKDTSITDGTVNITDWNGSNGYGYEKTPFTSTIHLINTNEVLATQAGSIDLNGNKNTYSYSVKFGTLVGAEQTAGNYEGLIRFGLDLDY